MATEEPQTGDQGASSSAPPPSETTATDTSTEAAPPVVGDSAVSSSSAPPPDDTSAKNEDPHPDGISTADVEGTVGAQPAGAEADPNAEVSPTGTENVAGTPQSQLSQAPPMTDPSGSNIPAPNLRQPLAEGADPTAGAASTTANSLDPALVDPVETAKARVEGRTSDASLRAADGPHIDEVPADLGDGPKSSDAGPERYPFPQGGDVDVATVPDGNQDGEYYPNLTIEDSVILVEHELVPDRLVGRRAFIIDAPRYLVPMDKKDEVWITVRTRDEVNATLNLPLAAVDVKRGATDVTVRG